MPWAYASLTEFKSRIDLAEATTGEDAHFRQILEAASRMIDRHSGRVYRIFTATRYQSAEWTDRLDLDEDLQSITTLKTDDDGDRTYDETWAVTDYDLLPFNAAADQRPYSAIEITPDGTKSFPTMRKGVEIAASWGYFEDLETCNPTTNEAVDASETEITVSDVDGSPPIEVLDTILIDSEQMYVTARDTSANTITVERGVNGTTAATHSTATTIKRYRYPGPIVEATILQASRLWNRKDAPFGIVGNAELGQINIPQGLDRDVKTLLAPYVKLRRLVAVV